MIKPRQQIAAFVNEEQLFGAFFGPSVRAFTGTLNVNVTSGASVSILGLIQKHTGELLATSSAKNAFRPQPEASQSLSVAFSREDFDDPLLGKIEIIEAFDANVFGDLVIGVRFETDRGKRAVLARLRGSVVRIMYDGQQLKYRNKDVSFGVPLVGPPVGYACSQRQRLPCRVLSRVFILNSGEVFFSAGTSQLGRQQVEVLFRWEDQRLSPITDNLTIFETISDPDLAFRPRLLDWKPSLSGDSLVIIDRENITGFVTYSGKTRTLLRVSRTGSITPLCSLEHDCLPEIAVINDRGDIAFEAKIPSLRSETPVDRVEINLIDTGTTETVSGVPLDTPLIALNDQDQYLFNGLGLLTGSNELTAFDGSQIQLLPHEQGLQWPMGSTDHIVAAFGYLLPSEKLPILLWLETESEPDLFLNTTKNGYFVLWEAGAFRQVLALSNVDIPNGFQFIRLRPETLKWVSRGTAFVIADLSNDPDFDSHLIIGHSRRESAVLEIGLSQ